MTSLLRCLLAVTLVFPLGACGEAKAETCYQYSYQIDDLIAAGDNEALRSFIEDSQEHVAGLISADPDRAEPCVEAVLEAILMVEIGDIESLFEE